MAVLIAEKNAETTSVLKKNQKNFKYHHGNLREALIENARALLDEEGLEALSLRRLAKITGVTQAAPYSHFKDKDDLLAAIAETGFQHLSLQMADDALGATGTKNRIQRLMTSYIRFAVENKALFHLMFGRELADMKKYPTLAMTAGKSYALFGSALSQNAKEGTDTRFLTVTIWSLCHGLTTLIMDQKIKTEQFGTDSIESFVEKNIALLDSHF